MPNSNNDFFDCLSRLGFSDLEGISIYQEENPKEITRKTHQPCPTDYIYDKKVTCPVCSQHINVRSVKSSGVRVLSKDSDFMTYYREPNPMFYDAWLCTKCGYAALSNKFNILSDKQRMLIKDNISLRWKFNKVYPAVYDIDTAIEMHQMVLLNTVAKLGKDSEKAAVCLKLAWLYRIKKADENENKFLYQALQGFLRAFEKENFPVAGLDEPDLQYLIGELYRRLGDYSNAFLWFSRVLFNKAAKERIKDMARVQKDLIRGNKSSGESG